MSLASRVRGLSRVSPLSPVAAHPRTDRRAGGQVPGWWLRAILLLVCLLAVAVVVQGEAAQRLGPVSVIGAALVIAGTVLLPGTAMTTAFLVVLAAAVLDRQDPSVVRVVLAASLLHAVHLLAALCALGPPSTRYDVAGLLPSARRWAVAQVVALPVAVGAGLAGRVGLPAGLAGPAVPAAAGLLAVVLVFGTVALARRAAR